jgi:osomolarity two-component system sensor histidine kinase SLN1
MMSSVLAVQNMEATGSVPKDQELEFKALTGSLSMMSKVLNDVLDL